MPTSRLPVSPDATPVIIAGAPRSGTTFLTTALNTHPQVMITNELRAWIVFNDLRLRTEQPSESLPDHPMREQFRTMLLNNCRNTFLNFYRRRLTKEKLGCPAPETGDSVEPVIKAFGDKNPSYADTHSKGCLDFIARSMKNAKFIHIHRDPRSCAASYKDVPIYAKTVDRWINIWTRHTQSMVDLYETLGPDRVLQFAYEDFVTEKGDAIIRRIEEHIGVDHAREPLEFLARERIERTPYRSPTTSQSRLGETTFQDRLTSEESDLLESGTIDLVKKLQSLQTW
jgi:LPS sulfotransferase NodH